MCSHCVQTCPRFPSDLKHEGKESLSHSPPPSAGSHPPRYGGLLPSGSTARFKERKTNSSLCETKAGHTKYPQPRLSKRRQKKRGLRIPRTEGRLNRRRFGVGVFSPPREGQASPHEPGGAIPEGGLP